MTRKLEMKKIEDNTKCQVTYSKRRNSLFKKAEELSIFCDVDIAFLAFSPSGRISKFCSFRRIEDMLARYVDLPADKRLSYIKDIQVKIQKLKELDGIRNDDHREQHLRDQFEIENMELQIKKIQLDVQLAEADLRNFELDPDHESSLQQISWCEKNLQQALAKLKEVLKGKTWNESEDDEIPSLRNIGENNLHSGGYNSSSGLLQHQKEVDPWMNDLNIIKTPENIFKEILDKGKGKAVTNAYGASETTSYNTTPNFPTTISDPIHQVEPSHALFKNYQEAPEMKNDNYNAPITNMNYSNVAFAPETFNGQTYVPSQIHAGHGFPQQYPQNNYSYAMAEDYKLWQQTQTPWQQVEPNSSIEAFAGQNSKSVQNDQSAFPQSANYGTGCFVQANNYCWTSMGQNPNPMQIMNQQNMMIFNDNADNNMHGNHEYGNNGNNDMMNDNMSYENDDICDEIIVSPSPSNQ